MVMTFPESHVLSKFTGPTGSGRRSFPNGETSADIYKSIKVRQSAIRWCLPQAGDDPAHIVAIVPPSLLNTTLTASDNGFSLKPSGETR